MDIKRQVFKRSMRGYDIEEVQSFLEMVAGQFEELIKENKGLAEHLGRLKFENEKYEKLEKTIQETLINSQKTLEESKANAKHEAKLIIKDAEIKAEQLIRVTDKKRDELKKEIVSLQDQKNMFVIRFRSLIKSQLEMLDVLESELKTGDKTSKEIDPVKKEPQEQPASTPAANSQDEGRNFSTTI
jgi:cell division initiation protein